MKTSALLALVFASAGAFTAPQRNLRSVALRSSLESQIDAVATSAKSQIVRPPPPSVVHVPRRAGAGAAVRTLRRA